MIEEKYSYIQAWADWIDSIDTWDAFATLTFRGYPHPETADKTFRVWMSKINKTLYGQNHWKRKEGITCARASEYQYRGTVHYHALLGRLNTKRLKLQAMKDMWHDLAGIARMSRYNKNLGGSFYVSKSAYAWKNGEVDIFGNSKYLCQLPLDLIPKV